VREKPSLASRAHTSIGLLSELRWRDDLALPLVVTIVQVAAGAAINWHHHHLSELGVVGWACLVVGPLALVVRRRQPVGTLCVAFAATLGPSGSSAANLSLIVAFFVVATHGHRRAAWASIAAGFVWSAWLGPLAYRDKTASAAFALVLGAWLAVLVMAAEAVRVTRERRAEALAARAIEARRQASEERLRMARDLHDVIGHNISLISFQAGVGLDLWESQPDEAHAALAAIKAVSKDALKELRALLGALRQEEDEAPRSPIPGLARLGELVELTRAAGLTVTTEFVGDPVSLPAGVDLAAYRIVQESLTNVARHAPGARTTVRVTYESSSVVVEVFNDCPTSGRNDTAAGTGSGITGMRERAMALGGQLAAGHRTDGSFVVTAHLPGGVGG
jgi:signal transduction histidine kinase